MPLYCLLRISSNSAVCICCFNWSISLVNYLYYFRSFTSSLCAYNCLSRWSISKRVSPSHSSITSTSSSGSRNRTLFLIKSESLWLASAYSVAYLIVFCSTTYDSYTALISDLNAGHNHSNTSITMSGRKYVPFTSLDPSITTNKGLEFSVLIS